MSVDDLYPLWLQQGRDEIEEHVQRMQRGYDSIVHKDSTYGRSVKAMLDLRIKLLTVWDSAPKVLEKAP